MGFGIVSALSGIKAREMELEVLANNIANMQTTGYKEMSVSFSSELNKNQPQNPDLAAAQATLKSGSTYVNFKMGSVYHTNNPTDVALQGEGFFTIKTPDGTRYTRDGNFSLSADGTLINSQGHAVLSVNGPIVVPQGTTLNISASGEVISNKDSLGKLLIKDFVNKQNLKLEGHNYYNADGLEAKESTNASVLQGKLENSNVNLVNNMTRIIQVSRAYESLQKTIKQQIASSKLLNQLAKIG